MELNTEDMTETPATEAPAATETKAPARRRASRRVSAAPATDAAVAAEVTEAAAPAAEEGAEAAPKKRVTRTRKKAAEAPAEAPETPAVEAPVAVAADAVEETPKKRATRSRKKVVEVQAAEEAAIVESAASTTATEAAQAPVETAEPAAEKAAPVRRTRGRRAQAETPAAESAEAAAPEAAPAENASSEADATNTKSETNGTTADAAADNGRSRNRRGRGQKTEPEAAAAESEQADRDSDDSKGRGQNGNRNGNGDRNGDKNSLDGARSSRTRQRDRKRRGQGDDVEPEIAEDDVLLPIAGILDVLDNYAFVRTSGYLPGTSDVYVSLGQVKKYGLRRGDAVVGSIRQPREGDGSSRQKYNAIVKVDSINGRPIDEDEKRVDISEMTPIFPQERLRLETTAQRLVGRGIDLVAPVGLGQRGVLVLPTQVHAIGVLSEIADAATANRPDAHLMMVLTEAKPEEVTQLQRTVRGEVIAATFDRGAEDQTTIVELAIDRARRLAELGHDVVLLLDSLNRLGRAYTLTQPGAGRATAEPSEEYALAHVKRTLGAARNLENGGSLTILATLVTKTGIALDKVLLREARQVCNSEIRFVKAAAGQVPQVNLVASHTQNLDSMMGTDEANALGLIRLALADDDGAKKVLERVRAATSNAALLAEIQRAGRLA